MLKHFNHLLLYGTGTRYPHSKQRKLVDTVAEGTELIHQKIQVDKVSGVFSHHVNVISAHHS